MSVITLSDGHVVNTSIVDVVEGYWLVNRSPTTTWRRRESGQWRIYSHTVSTMLELTTVLKKSDHQLEKRGIWTVDIISCCIYYTGTDHCSEKTSDHQLEERGIWTVGDIPHCIYHAGTDHCSKKTSDHQLEERGIWTVGDIPHCIYHAGTDHCSKKTSDHQLDSGHYTTLYLPCWN